MVEESKQSVSGCWYGNYYYASAGDKPYAFEAVFIENKGAVSGNILDLGVHGEASVTGSFSSGKLAFTKVYYKTGGKSIQYEGTINDQGDMLSGQWQIPPLARGSWIAWRVEEMDNLEELLTDTESDAERETTPQPQVSRSG